MAQKWANNAFSTLGGAIDDLDTSITVATDTGDRFPAVSGDDFFNITLQNAGGDVEIVKVISRAIGSDEMTIVRGQEATVPLSWAIGDIVELRPTAASFENLDERIDTAEQAIEDLDFNADAIGFDDDAVSFEADNVQEAIDSLAASVPSGAVMNFAMLTAPSGWLKADGSAVSRSTYSSLFSAIGTTFGNGNGSTTFNLPDLRGEFIRGWDDGRGVDSGRAFGSNQSSQNEAHSHSGSTNSAGSHSHSGSTSSVGNHTHNMQNFAEGPLGGGKRGHRAWDDRFIHNQSTGGGGSHSHSLSINSAGSHVHSFSTNSSGGNESRPRNIALLTCIKI